MNVKDTYTVILFNPIEADKPYVYHGVARGPTIIRTEKIEFITEEGRRVVSNLKFLVVQEAEEEAKAK